MLDFRCTVCLLLLQYSSYVYLVSAEVCTTEGDVRLADRKDVNEGRVEICVDGQWGTVCDDNWGVADATVVCSQLGLASEYADALYKYGGGSGPIHYANFQCSGHETHLVDCSVGPQFFCFHFEDAGVRCSNTPCDENAVRLNADAVQVCRGGEWGLVCYSEHWNQDAVHVVCNQLGFSSSSTITYSYGGASLYDARVWVNDVLCLGSENSLLDCDLSYGNFFDCTFIGLAVCRVGDQKCNESDVRLVGGLTPDDGRVEVCLDGVWGSVCDDQWDIRDAEVVCRQLHYNGPSYPLLSHESSDIPPPILLDGVHCDGTENLLTECNHRGIGIENCADREGEAGVICTNVTCEDGTVHLVGGDDVSRGRVEYCYEGTWYTVCASGWEDNGEEARVVCSTLGYSYDSVITNFSRGTSPILPLSVRCGVDDTALSDCVMTDLNVTQCPHVAGVDCKALCLVYYGHTGCGECDSRASCGVLSGKQTCNCYSDCYEYGDCCSDVTRCHKSIGTVEECETGEIRLVGGVTNSVGRLEVCANGIWGRVCNRLQYWGPDNARVVCHQLGFSEDGAYVVDDASVFGTSDRYPLFGKVHCIGTEPKLLECLHSGIGGHECGRDQDPVPDIAISCYDEATSCEDGEVRLEGGFTPSDGRVEFCQYRTWGAVCGEGWDDSDARVVCGQLGYNNPKDAQKVEGFRMAEDMPVFLEHVQCLGSETLLRECMNTTTTTGACGAAAGVTCKEISTSERCAHVADTLSNMATDYQGFGKCEVYEFPTYICNGILRHGVDFVYISNKLSSTQSNLSTTLNHKLQGFVSIHDKDCVELVFRVMCHYYLPPCGNFTHPLPPTSLCQEECAHIQGSCPATWEAATIAFTDPPFINCEGTFDLLSPLPTCCTGAGIIENLSPDSNDGITDGNVAGIVIGVLLVAVVTGIFTVWLVCIYFKGIRRKRLQRMQLDDIMAIPGLYEPQVPGLTDTKNEKELDEKSLKAIAHHSPYGIPNATMVTSLTSDHSRARIPSKSFRELTRGRFLVKYEDITLLHNIGEGEFGVVYKAKLGKIRQVVAVKTLKGHFDQIEEDQFVKESLKMSRFKHSHIMSLIGVCLDTGSTPFIIMPYMDNGSLLKYLRSERENVVFSDKDEVQEVQKRLMVMCCQIASGMEYLASEKYVHRDLAARNCMIDAHFIIKITDFGLSEDMFMRNYFRQGTADMVKLPVKWMAPESLSDGHFSEKSDVWSYGVVMWEIFSGGKTPFPGTDPLTLMQCLEAGQRMPKPYNTACTDEIYAMMIECWEQVPHDRPTFKALYSKISKYIEHVASYLELGYNPFSVGRGASKDNKEVSKEEEDEEGLKRDGSPDVERKEDREGEREFEFQVIPPSV